MRIEAVSYQEYVELEKALGKRIQYKDVRITEECALCCIQIPGPNGERTYILPCIELNEVETGDIKVQLNEDQVCQLEVGMTIKGINRATNQIKF